MVVLVFVGLPFGVCGLPVFSDFGDLGSWVDFGFLIGFGFLGWAWGFGLDLGSWWALGFWAGLGVLGWAWDLG